MGRRRKNGKGNKKRCSGKPSLRRQLDLDESSNSGSSSSISIDFDAPLPFDIGTRVELPNLKGYSEPNANTPHTGTVAGHWKRRDHWPEHLRAPYLILLDDGMAIYCHRTDAEFLRETGVPPMTVTFNIGCRVECQLEADNGKWFPGTVLQSHSNWHLSPIDTPPYFIRFDYGRERPFWGPPERIRAIERKKWADKNMLPPLRFELGDRVLCAMEDDWMPGQIVKTWYQEDEFENDHAVPYQVLLDNGDFIYAPMDDDDCIKKSAAVSVSLRFDVGDMVNCKVEEGWEPGMIASTEYREEGLYGGRLVPYEIRLKCGDFVYAPCDNDLFIRKQLRFKVGDRVDCFISDWMPGTVIKTEVEDEDFNHGRVVPYKIQLDTGDTIFTEKDDDSIIKQSTAPRVCRGELNGFVHVMSKMLIYNEAYEESKLMLLERIEKIRSNIKNNAHDNDESMATMKVDLSNFLLHLAETYQGMGLLKEMKDVLDEALALVEMSQDGSKYGSKCHRLLNVTAKLATYAALTSDKHAALVYSEEAILLARQLSGGHDSFRLGLMVFQCGKLNVGCHNRERGIAQMSEGMEILTRLYGSDNEHVLAATGDLHKILLEDGD